MEKENKETNENAKVKRWMLIIAGFYFFIMQYIS